MDSIAGLNGGGGAAYVASKAAGLGITKTHGHAVCKRRGSVQCHLSGHDQDSDDSRTDDGFYGPGYDGGHGCAFLDLRLPACSAEDVANSNLTFWPVMNLLLLPDSVSCWITAQTSKNYMGLGFSHRRRSQALFHSIGKLQSCQAPQSLPALFFKAESSEQ